MRNMGTCPSSAIGKNVEGWVILKDGDKLFDPKFNDNTPYYYNKEEDLYWRRNLFGWGPPLVNDPVLKTSPE